MLYKPVDPDLRLDRGRSVRKVRHGLGDGPGLASVWTLLVSLASTHDSSAFRHILFDVPPPEAEYNFL